jgi:Zn-dependent peptidase ImmA (M78 family)
MTTATKAARTRAERRYGWFREIVAYLKRFIHFPAVKFPDFGLPADPTKITSDQIEQLASEVRRAWNLGDGPISNVTWLLENNGAVVARHRLDADKLDAFSEWDAAEGRSYVILGADKCSAARSRYDAGHELGHMVLHRSVPKMDFAKGELFKLMEDQAHRFTGAFLLPERAFSEDFYSPSLDALAALKPKWKVSIAFMVKRSRNLGLISDEQERRLFINRSRRGWRQREPLDDTLEPELPRFVRRSIELLIDKGVVARHDIPFQLALTPGDIEELAGLRPGYLTESDDPSAVLKLPQCDAQPKPGGCGDGPSHIPFRTTR